MQSTVKLYNAPEIIPSRLFIIDDLETYLATLTNTQTITKFQYIKQGLKVSIKIDKNQTSLDPLSTSKLWNYCSIQNYIDDQNEEKRYYYFVMNKRWIASSTLELELELDSINTFRPSTAFTIKDQTTINRMHKDRFTILDESTKTETLYISGKTAIVSPAIARYTYEIQNLDYAGRTLDNYSITINNSNVGEASHSFDPDTGDFEIIFQSSSAEEFSAIVTFELVTSERYVRKIDLASEGLTPVLYGAELGEIEDENNNDYYLVYRGTSDVTCYLYTENPLEVYVAGSDEIHPNDLTTGTYYYLMEDRTFGASRVQATLTTDSGDKFEVSFYYGYLAWFPASERNCCVFYTDGTKIYIRKLIYHQYSNGSWFYDGGGDFVECNSLTLKGNSIQAHTLNSSQTSLTPIYNGSIYEFTISGGFKTIKSFSALDRTQSDIIKIIKLPYPPLDLTQVSPDWSYNNTYGALQLSNLDIRFNCQLVENDNPLNELNVTLSPALTDLKNANNESKLFHSDYYQTKFIYDSFTKIFALERINLSTYDIVSETPLYINFVATNTINSRFLFSFNQYNTDSYALDDYENILYINRNNEVVIYNSAYLDYVKTGFNYDVKAKERQTTGNWLGFGLSLVGSIASFASSAAGSGGFGIAGGISLATTAMSQLTKAVNNTAQAEATQQQKLLQLAQQRNSVYGADDVDLMTYYCNNKAKLMRYKVSDRMKSILWDLFFFTGYQCGYKGIPNYTSRIRFNFVSCELELIPVMNITEDIIKDIKTKYSAGVTFIHNVSSTWDFDQKYENWETSLF